jgi:hypothetical protein
MDARIVYGYTGKIIVRSSVALDWAYQEKKKEVQYDLFFPISSYLHHHYLLHTHT